MQTYDVRAVIDPSGRAEIVNTITHKTFYTISNVFSIHTKTRWVVVNSTGEEIVRVVDLWKTTLGDEFPYEIPHFVEETFKSTSQAIGFVVLNLC